MWSQHPRGHRNTRGAWVRQSSQVSERGSQQQRRRQAVGSQLGVTLNCDPRYRQATALQAGTPQVAHLGRLTFLLQDEWCRSILQESAGFGDSERGCAPEIETLGHRPGELRVRPETREMGGIDCFSLRVHWGVRPWALSSYGTGDWEAAICIPGLQSCTESVQRTKAPKNELSRLLSLAPDKGGAIPPWAKTLENHSNSLLPQKISKNIQPRPSLLINENCGTPELGENNT